MIIRTPFREEDLRERNSLRTKSRGKPTNMLRSLCIVLLFAVPALTGCRQGDGERCQVQSDCDDNLICVLPPGGSPQTGGVCRDVNDDQDLSTVPADFSTTSPDLGPPADLRPPDLQPSQDSSVVD